MLNRASRRCSPNSLTDSVCICRYKTFYSGDFFFLHSHKYEVEINKLKYIKGKCLKYFSYCRKSNPVNVVPHYKLNCSLKYRDVRVHFWHTGSVDLFDFPTAWCRLWNSVCRFSHFSKKNKGNSQKMLIKYGLFLTRTRATKADGHVKYGQAFKEIGQCVWTKHLYAKLISIA